ncbi:MAG TPA: hypothetical protein VHQ00_09130 [Chloroflexota bacterium]|nr:hypothetical protein [Chloroflexota bacterium]
MSAGAGRTDTPAGGAVAPADPAPALVGLPRGQGLGRALVVLMITVINLDSFQETRWLAEAMTAADAAPGAFAGAPQAPG